MVNNNLNKLMHQQLIAKAEESITMAKDKVAEAHSGSNTILWLQHIG